MKSRLLKTFAIVLISCPILLSAQDVGVGELGGQDTDRNPITTAVPFLSFAPDSRASAMGDVGVATSADVYSVHWNNAKLAFLENKFGASLSYSGWLRTLVDDISLNYLTGYYKIDQIQTVAASIRYFDLGEIQLTNDQGQSLGVENPREFAFDLTYSRKLSENMGIGVTGRLIQSNIAGNISSAPEAQNATSVAIDLGWYYLKDITLGGNDADLSFGAHISNFGQKVTYSTESNEDFIPGNLRLGTGLKMNLDDFNSLGLYIDFNKLLVPTTPTYEKNADGSFVKEGGEKVIAEGKDPDRPLLSGTFGSFGDAPGGGSEELKEVMISFGAEYMYRDVFGVRFGYFHESELKGARKYFTAGVGLKYQVVGVDFAYLIPTQDNHPLANTLRLSINFNFQGS